MKSYEQLRKNLNDIAKTKYGKPTPEESGRFDKEIVDSLLSGNLATRTVVGIDIYKYS